MSSVVRWERKACQEHVKNVYLVQKFGPHLHFCKLLILSIKLIKLSSPSDVSSFMMPFFSRLWQHLMIDALDSGQSLVTFI